MGGTTSRRKGHDFERWVARRLREEFPGRNVQRGIQTRGGGAEAADVVVEGWDFHVECKVGKKPNVRAALKQALSDAKEGKTPIAVIKDDRQKPFITMMLDDFLAVYSEGYNAGKRAMEPKERDGKGPPATVNGEPATG